MFERSEFATLPFSAAHRWEPRRGPGSRGRLLLLSFSWRDKKSKRLPGRSRQGRPKKTQHQHLRNQETKKPRNEPIGVFLSAVSYRRGNVRRSILLQGLPAPD